MCGIVGIVGTTEVAAALYDGLTVLQHRGQDAAGIATTDGRKLRVHKGNGLVREVFDEDRRNVNTESDSEVLLNVFAHELDTQKALTPESVFRAVEGVNRRARGGYAVITAVLGLGLVAFRDPHGIRPLVLGKRSTAAGDEYIVASESVALDVLGFERLRDVA